MMVSVVNEITNPASRILSIYLNNKRYQTKDCSYNIDHPNAHTIIQFIIISLVIFFVYILGLKSYCPITVNICHTNTDPSLRAHYIFSLLEVSKKARSMKKYRGSMQLAKVFIIFFNFKYIIN